MDEPLVETIELDSDEDNELLFKVNIEGNVVGPAKVRLVCEADNVSYMFPGHAVTQPGLVQFVIQRGSGLKDGSYPARVEVMVENRYFVPVSFNVELKKKVSVVVEHVAAPKVVVKKDDVKVSAVPVIRPKAAPTPIVIEGPTPKKPVLPRPVKTLADRYNQRKKS